MGKDKLEDCLDITINKKHTCRHVLRDNETIVLTNESGVEMLVTIFPSVHHE